MGQDKQAVMSLGSSQEAWGSNVFGLGKQWGTMGDFRAEQLHESVGLRIIPGSRKVGDLEGGERSYRISEGCLNTPGGG